MEKLEFLQHIETQKQVSLWHLSHQQPVLVVLLRHFGCVFCKEALTELGSIKEKIRSYQTHIVLVHLSDNETAEPYFAQYDLSDVDYVSDPDAKIYHQFGLLKGELREMMGLKVWLRSLEQGLLKGHGLKAKVIGDGFQMPGVFLIYEGSIREKFIHQTVADRPDYLKLADCPACKPT